MRGQRHGAATSGVAVRQHHGAATSRAAVRQRYGAATSRAAIRKLAMLMSHPMQHLEEHFMQHKSTHLLVHSYIQESSASLRELRGAIYRATWKHYSVSDKPAALLP